MKKLNKGIYKVKTIQVKLKVEEPIAKVKGVKEVVNILKGIYDKLDEDQEHFILLALDSNLNIRGYKVISSGAMNYNYVDPKLVFRNALLLGGVRIIVSHNHPSNNILPSQDDINLTKKLIEGSKLLGIDLIDHIIYSNKGYISLREMGYI